MSKTEYLQRSIKPSTAMSELKDAWDEMIDLMQQARNAIDDPVHQPPSTTDRNLAEGYRYLLGYVHGAYERAFGEDPDRPYFRRAIPLLHKSTADNADNLYLSAAIDGDGTYVIQGRANECAHWRGTPPSSTGPLAPRYAIFSTITHYTGDSGELSELVPDVTVNIGSLESPALEVENDGRFEILLAPERPAGHTGNFIPTRTVTDDGTEQIARYLIARELFADWAREEALELEIHKIECRGLAQPPLTPDVTASRMRRMGEIVRNHLHFWNSFYSTLLNPYGDSPLDTPYSFPGVNEVIQPSPPSAMVGAAQQTNIYSGGIYKLESDEVLIVEQEVPVKPLYGGFNLCNWWGESYDYANYCSSLNSSQAVVDSDGKIRFVVSHQDPGVHNWLDTTDHADGMLSQRWVYSEVPEDLPRVRCHKVKLADLFDHLPPDTVRTDPGQRRKTIAERQAHAQRRYRQY